MSINRFAGLIFFTAAASFAQGLTFGFVGGAPLTVLLHGDSSPSPLILPSPNPESLPWVLASNVTDRYIVGPSVGWRFHGGFAVEFDVLYRHLGYENFIPTGMGYSVGYNLPVSGDAEVSAGDWEFPLQVKYRLPEGSLQSVFPGADVRPYISAGAAFDTLRISDSYSLAYGCLANGSFPYQGPGSPPPPEPCFYTGETNSPTAFGLQHKNVFGTVTGVGLDVRWGRVHILPEVRYTWWTRLHFDANFENSARNQVEFLVGISR